MFFSLDELQNNFNGNDLRSFNAARAFPCLLKIKEKKTIAHLYPKNLVNNDVSSFIVFTDDMIYEIKEVNKSVSVDTYLIGDLINFKINEVGNGETIAHLNFSDERGINLISDRDSNSYYQFDYSEKIKEIFHWLLTNS
ncbi:hypothetical protein [Evansella tamaricis]|uniref:Uncharacterized protein n=1 Tax=Evansella tamaricis TaxID=2069301 RepID=A0ABS6JL98_9BACI|nr:hypothetical protein [Evansella tamaricis]MBU9714433.1 hypothetical protein [Evansella tamaricis]